MKIIINDYRKVFAIEEEFNQMFPNLKIEFMAKPSGAGAKHSDMPVSQNKTIADCRIIHNEGHVTIIPTMTIRDLQNYFSDLFGLAVIIYKKSQTDWIEASDTGIYSLDEQNMRKLPVIL